MKKKKRRKIGSHNGNLEVSILAQIVLNFERFNSFMLIFQQHVKGPSKLQVEQKLNTRPRSPEEAINTGLSLFFQG